MKGLFDEEKLEQVMKEKLDIKHGFVKEFMIHWMEKPNVGPYGQQDGAIFKAAVVPFWPPLWGGPTNPQEVRIYLESIGYFHHGSPADLEERAERFRSGPAKEFLAIDPNRRSINVSSDAGAIEPGHYIIDVFIRCTTSIKVPKKKPEARITNWLKKTQEKILKVLKKF